MTSSLRRVAMLSAAIPAFMASSPAFAAVTIVDPSCSLTTGCKFTGNIQGAGTALETQNAYNAVKDPDIVLNYLGKTDDPFVSVTGAASGSGTWSLPGYVVDYIAVKSGPAFMLYSVTPGDFTWSTAGLQNGNNTNLPALSHLAFFGHEATSAVPEPASWALLLGGFGMIGASLRRRQQAKVTFA